MHRGKKYLDSVKAYDKQNQFEPDEALNLVIQNAKAKFDETVELHIRLGVDSRHADQQVRGAVVLPHGTGKKVRAPPDSVRRKNTGTEPGGRSWKWARTPPRPEESPWQRKTGNSQRFPLGK